MSELTQILERVQKGDQLAAGEILPVVYDELRKLAAQKIAREAAGHILQPTALVHEAWLLPVAGGSRGQGSVQRHRDSQWRERV
jgi:hypothetical protein